MKQNLVFKACFAWAAAAAITFQVLACKPSESHIEGSDFASAQASATSSIAPATGRPFWFGVEFIPKAGDLTESLTSLRIAPLRNQARIPVANRAQLLPNNYAVAPATHDTVFQVVDLASQKWQTGGQLPDVMHIRLTLKAKDGEAPVCQTKTCVCGTKEPISIAAARYVLLCDID